MTQSGILLVSKKRVMSENPGLDAAEAVANAFVGLALSVAAVQLLWPLFGWPVTAGQSVAVSAIFFALSVARGYVLRRVFRRLGG
jgi:hypothetical protein